MLITYNYFSVGIHQTERQTTELCTFSPVGTTSETSLGEGYPPVYQQSDYSPYTMPQKRTAPIVLGIIGLVFSFLLPIVTYPCSIVGVVMANSDNKRGAKNTSGLVLNIVALVIAALNSILGAILGMMGALSY